jgi:glycosyltransferase involved in cell wall biosynthesis
MLVSIITVSFNSANTILETIKSVNNQTYSKIEHIFIDGASNDNTVKIIENSSTRTRLIVSEKDNGIYNAMNKGLKLAKGGIIGFLNSDDRLYNNDTINQIVTEFNFNIDCVYGDLIFVNSNNKIVRKWKSRKFKSGLFRYSWTPAHPTFYCKKSVYDSLGYYREDFSIAADGDLMFRFLEVHKIASCYLNQTLVEMKIGGVSTHSLKSKFIITREIFTTFHDNNYKFSKILYWAGKCFKGIKQLL